MSMQVGCWGYEMIIRSDRFEEAQKWLEDHLGWDPLKDYLHKDFDDGFMSLSLDNFLGEGPFWGNVTYSAYDTLEGFAEKFACEGTYFNLSFEEDGEWFSRIEAKGGKVLTETIDASTVFKMLEQRIDSRSERTPVDDLGAVGGGLSGAKAAQRRRPKVESSGSSIAQ